MSSVCGGGGGGSSSRVLVVKAQLNSRKAAINVQWLRRGALLQNFDADANRGAASPYPVGRIYSFMSHIARRLWLDGCGGCILETHRITWIQQKNPLIITYVFGKRTIHKLTPETYRELRLRLPTPDSAKQPVKIRRQRHVLRCIS